MDRLGSLSSDGQFFLDLFLLGRATCFKIHPIYNCSHPRAVLLIMYSISVPPKSHSNAVGEPWMRRSNCSLWKAALLMSPQPDPGSFEIFLDAASLLNQPKLVWNTTMCDKIASWEWHCVLQNHKWTSAMITKNFREGSYPMDNQLQISWVTCQGNGNRTLTAAGIVIEGCNFWQQN